MFSKLNIFRTCLILLEQGGTGAKLAVGCGCGCGPVLHNKYPILVLRGQSGVKLAKIGVLGALMHHGVKLLEEHGCNVMCLGLMK